MPTSPSHTQPTTAARAAAEWWGVAVGAPAFNNTTAAERSSMAPDDRWTTEMTSVMASMIAAGHPVDDQAAKGFVDLLETAIGQATAGTNWFSLGVDYGPDRLLAEAAVAAGVHGSRFPWKTNMWITPDYVTVSAGYRAATRLVWQSPDWVRPTCGDIDWPEGAEKATERLCTRPKFHDSPCGDWMPDTRRCGGCGGSYTEHYGTQHGDFHTWQPAVAQ